MFWLLLLPTTVFFLWSCGALWFDSKFSEFQKRQLLLILCALSVSAAWLSSLSVLSLLVPNFISLTVLIWWTGLKPSNEADWAPEYGRLPLAELHSEILTIHNVRNAECADIEGAEIRWETRKYNLEELVGLDIYFCHWGPKHIAHTIVAWEFSNAAPLAISIETRRPRGQGFSGIKGFFRQFLLHYVVADESDIIRVRTNSRNEDVYQYRFKASYQMARDLLLDYCVTFNSLHSSPVWYNATTHNCTTMIRQHLQEVAGEYPWSWRLLFNAHLPWLGYLQGTFFNKIPFRQFQEQSYVSGRARNLPEGENFSEFIRANLPPRPVPSTHP